MRGSSFTPFYYLRIFHNRKIEYEWGNLSLTVVDVCWKIYKNHIHNSVSACSIAHHVVMSQVARTYFSGTFPNNFCSCRQVKNLMTPVCNNQNVTWRSTRALSSEKVYFYRCLNCPQHLYKQYQSNLHFN